MRRAAHVLLVAAAVACGASPSQAQEFFPRFDFGLSGAYFVEEDSRFNWAFEFAGDLDVVDWTGGRATFVAAYEAIAGEEFRRFDVNQGNYLLEGVVVFRAGGVEIGPVWHHVSRHLSDRSKRPPIDWNMLAFRARRTMPDDRDGLAWRADVRRTITRAFVDYDWEVEGGASLARRVSPRLVATASGGVRIVATDGSRERGTQAGGRLEGAIRTLGRRASAEVFAAFEQRVDPYPTAFGTGRWLTTGLRLRSR